MQTITQTLELRIGDFLLLQGDIYKLVEDIKISNYLCNKRTHSLRRIDFPITYVRRDTGNS